MTIAIVCAMPEELEVLREALGLQEIENPSPWSVSVSGDRRVMALISGVGKVNAAAALSFLLSSYPIKAVIGIGVAGGIAPELGIGDIVICRAAAHHDLDLTAFGYELGAIPGLGIREICADRGLVAKAVNVGENEPWRGLVRTGLVLTGDKFVAHGEGSRLRTIFGGHCVDMETAAWAQVAHRYAVPWVAIRSISDGADGGAPEDFKSFLQHAVEKMSCFVQQMLNHTTPRKAE